MSRAEEIERSIEQHDKQKVIKQHSDDDSESEFEDLEPPPVAVIERQEIPMPELVPGSEYLVAFLHSAGTATATGMGLTGLSWQELEAWAKCTDNIGIVSPRDMKILHTLSRAYANEYARASKKDAKPPYEPNVVLDEEVREVVSNKVDDLFASLVAFQSKGGKNKGK